MELKVIEKDEVFNIKDFELVKETLMKNLHPIIIATDKQTLQEAKNNRAEWNKNIKLLKDNLSAYKTTYFGVMEKETKELVNIFETQIKSQDIEISKYTEKLREEKMIALNEWFKTKDFKFPLEAYLEVGEIDLSLVKWSVEKAQEYIINHSNLNEKYKVELTLTKEEFERLEMDLIGFKSMPKITQFYEEE